MWFLLLQTQSILVDMRLTFFKNQHLETNWLLTLIVINLFQDFNFRTATNPCLKYWSNQITNPVSGWIQGSLISDIRPDTGQPDIRYLAGYRAARYPISGRIQGSPISDIRPDTVLLDVRPTEYPSYIRDNTKAGYPFHP